MVSSFPRVLLSRHLLTVSGGVQSHPHTTYDHSFLLHFFEADFSKRAYAWRLRGEAKTRVYDGVVWTVPPPYCHAWQVAEHLRVLHQHGQYFKQV